jgi:hypothetical protein
MQTNSRHTGDGAKPGALILTSRAPTTVSTLTRGGGGSCGSRNRGSAPGGELSSSEIGEALRSM